MEIFQISPLLLPIPLHTPWLLSSQSSPALPWLWSLALSPWFAAVGGSSGKTKKGKTWDFIQGRKLQGLPVSGIIVLQSSGRQGAALLVAACGSPVPALANRCAKAEDVWWLFCRRTMTSCCEAHSTLPLRKKIAPQEMQIVISWLRAVHTLTKNWSVVSESQRHQHSPLCPLNSS